MAVIVLGITVGRLIQPASAADQDKAEFVVDGDNSSYMNMAKLSNSPQIAVTGGMPVEWTGQEFKLSAELSFAITTSEAQNEDGTAQNNFYYMYGSNIQIPEELCRNWYNHSDERGKDAFQYHFVKNEDDTYSPCGELVIRYNGEPLDPNTVSKDYYFDNTEISNWHDVILTEADIKVHNFKVVVIYKEETKIANVNLVFTIIK